MPSKQTISDEILYQNVNRQLIDTPLLNVTFYIVFYREYKLFDSQLVMQNMCIIILIIHMYIVYVKTSITYYCSHRTRATLNLFLFCAHLYITLKNFQRLASLDDIVDELQEQYSTDIYEALLWHLLYYRKSLDLPCILSHHVHDSMKLH